MKIKILTAKWKRISWTFLFLHTLKSLKHSIVTQWWFWVSDHQKKLWLTLWSLTVWKVILAPLQSPYCEEAKWEGQLYISIRFGARPFLMRQYILLCDHRQISLQKPFVWLIIGMTASSNYITFEKCSFIYDKFWFSFYSNLLVGL